MFSVKLRITYNSRNNSRSQFWTNLYRVSFKKLGHVRNKNINYNISKGPSFFILSSKKLIDETDEIIRPESDLGKISSPGSPASPSSEPETRCQCHQHFMSNIFIWKYFCPAFLYLQFGFVIIWQKKYQHKNC